MKRRTSFASPLHRAADAYLVKRGAGQTIIAGYPWFTDWGRDTFIALRGVCLAADRIDEARNILLEWSRAISEGMLPNRFPDRGEAPEFNAVDASLWFVIAVYDLFDAAARCGTTSAGRRSRALEDAVDAILAGYARGTRFGIRARRRRPARCRCPGVQLTWMDARVGDHVITPRIGKPVEVQALWLNALWLASRRSPRWRELFDARRAAFEARFWNDAAGVLHDVVDVDHQSGHGRLVVPSESDSSRSAACRVVLVSETRARRASTSIEARLLTPVGLRSLAPDEPGYIGHYAGGVAARDGGYHQGTVWPWLLTAFVEAWVRVRGGRRRRSIADARERISRAASPTPRRSRPRACRRRSPTATLRTRPTAVRSRRGRSAKRCDSSGSSWHCKSRHVTAAPIGIEERGGALMRWGFDDAAAVLQRIRGEFREMPGLKLTIAQAARLWQLDPRQQRARCSTRSSWTACWAQAPTVRISSRHRTRPRPLSIESLRP